MTTASDVSEVTARLNARINSLDDRLRQLEQAIAALTEAMARLERKSGQAVL